METENTVQIDTPNGTLNVSADYAGNLVLETAGYFTERGIPWTFRARMTRGDDGTWAPLLEDAGYRFKHRSLMATRQDGKKTSTSGTGAARYEWEMSRAMRDRTWSILTAAVTAYAASHSAELDEMRRAGICKYAQIIRDSYARKLAEAREAYETAQSNLDAAEAELAALCS